MDTFEAARLKHAKNLERKLRTQEEEKVVCIEVPKEKASRDALIDVTVTLPAGSFSFRLVKSEVLQNVNPRLLNKNEFKNRLIEGLKPILGAVREG